MREEIEKVLEAMRTDYKRWSNACASHKSDITLNSHSKIKAEMEEDYCNGLEVTEGRRYWKITSGRRNNRSVSGFIVKAGDKKFREGDMLKPAGWAAPARNFSRGNVLEGTGLHNARWTGIG